MSDELLENEAGKDRDTADKPSSKTRPGVGLWLLTIVVLAALGISMLAYIQLGRLKIDSNRLETALVPIKSEILDLGKTLADSGREKQEINNLLVELQQQQSLMADSVQALFRQQNMANNDWALAEVEYLLVVATHRLQLERNVTLALAAMQAVDNRLRNSSDPSLLAVRQQLTADINALKAVETVDVAGLVLFLSDLVGRVVDLPLQQVKVNTDTGPINISDEQSSNWEKLLSSIWLELKSLVQISRQGEETMAILMPDQHYFLYQNLRLQLESARYAVLRRDTENLHVSVDIISDWLKDYFDSSDNGVANIIESMSQMSALELNPALPDISSSLESIRAYIRAEEIPPAIDEESLQENGQQ